VVTVAGSCSFERSKNYLQGPGVSWGISETGRCAGEWGEEKLCSSQTGGGERNRTDGRGRQRRGGKQCIYISDQK